MEPNICIFTRLDIFRVSLEESKDIFGRLRFEHSWKKNLVWHLHNFLLSYITIDEYFVIRITFIFNFYFLCFVVDELLPLIIVVYNLKFEIKTYFYVKGAIAP